MGVKQEDLTAYTSMIGLGLGLGPYSSAPSLLCGLRPAYLWSAPTLPLLRPPYMVCAFLTSVPALLHSPYAVPGLLFVGE